MAALRTILLFAGLTALRHQGRRDYPVQEKALVGAFSVIVQPIDCGTDGALHSSNKVLLKYTEYNEPHESLTNKNIIEVATLARWGQDKIVF